MQYGEFRSGYDKDTEDTRIVWFGIRYIVETYLNRRWTLQARGRCHSGLAATCTRRPLDSCMGAGPPARPVHA